MICRYYSNNHGLAGCGLIGGRCTHEKCKDYLNCETFKHGKLPRTITLAYCGLCEAVYAECPDCHNNSCNGGSGGEDGKCPTCSDTHELRELLYRYDKSGEMEKVMRKLLNADQIDKSGQTEKAIRKLFNEDENDKKKATYEKPKRNKNR